MLAAVSLSDALTEARDTFEAAGGGRVRLSFGASGVLATQVRRGAPADAVIFAGAGPMDALDRDGLIVEGTRRDVAGNSLVVVARAGSEVRVESLEALARGFEGRIAIGDVATVPAGEYARAALEAAGVWDAVQGRLLPVLDVRAAAAAVASGNAEFGFVYATDAAMVRDVEIALSVPAARHLRISYPAAAVRASSNVAAAAAFLDFLVSEDGQGVFRRHGFPPTAGGP